MPNCPRCSSALPEHAQVCPFCGEVLAIGTVPGLPALKRPPALAFDRTVQSRDEAGHPFRHSPEALTSTLPGRARRGRTAPLGPTVSPPPPGRGGTKVGLPRADRPGDSQGGRIAPQAHGALHESKHDTWLGGTPAAPGASAAAAGRAVHEPRAEHQGNQEAHAGARASADPPASVRGRVRERHDLALRASAFPSRPHAGGPLGLGTFGIAGLLLFALFVVGASVFYLTRRKDFDLVDCEVDEAGNTRLLVSCAQCAQGSLIRFGNQTAAFASGKALLSLGGSLPPGANSLTLLLEQPGGSPVERLVEANVPFLVKTDFRLLSEARPQAEFVIHALPRSAVIVDGRAVALDPFGVGRQTVELATDLTGAATETVGLKRSVGYSVTTPEGRAYQGNLLMQLPVTPLSVDAPGDHLITEYSTFTLAGRTHPDATLTVQGRPIAVDSQGLFAQLMNISAPGETVIAVRASLSGHAPRLYSIRIQRVESLRALAEGLRTRATQTYKDLLGRPEGKAGWQVALKGQVLSVSAKGRERELRLRVNPCPSAECPLRVLHAGTQSVAKDQFVEVFGQLLASKGATEPTVQADFFLDTSPPH